jgi:DNA repair ATPase RecN
VYTNYQVLVVDHIAVTCPQTTSKQVTQLQAMSSSAHVLGIANMLAGSQTIPSMQAIGQKLKQWVKDQGTPFAQRQRHWQAGSG